MWHTPNWYNRRDGELVTDHSRRIVRAVLAGRYWRIRYLQAQALERPQDADVLRSKIAAACDAAYHLKHCGDLEGLALFLDARGVGAGSGNGGEEYLFVADDCRWLYRKIYGGR